MDEITKGLLAACKTLVSAIPNPLHPARLQGQAAIDLAVMGHIPRRSLQADLDIMSGKASGRFESRRHEAALRQQIERQGVTGSVL